MELVRNDLSNNVGACLANAIMLDLQSANLLDLKGLNLKDIMMDKKKIYRERERVMLFILKM